MAKIRIPDGMLMGVFVVAVAAAQTVTSEIAGTVRDSTGGALPGVTITLTHQASGQTRQLTTEANGNYVTPALPVGEYTIKAELPNFESQLRQGIVLQVGRQAQIDLTLEVGNINQEVTINASAPALQTTNAELSEIIDNAMVTALPLNDGQFVDLTLLSDNVFVAPHGTHGSALTQTGPAMLVAKQRPGHNMYFLDRVSVTDQYFNHLVASPPIDAIEEFNIQK